MALGALIAGAVGTIVAAAVSVTKALAVAGLAIQGLKAIGAVFTALCKALGLIKRKLPLWKMSANYEKQKHRLFLCVLSL